MPGLLCTEALWAHQLRHLSHLCSPVVVDVTAADSIAGLAAAVLEQSPERFALCGLSMGGIISHEIMRRAPERVERLALVDTTARPEAPEQTEKRMMLLDLVGQGRFDAVPSTLMPALIHPDYANDQALTGAITQMALDVGEDAFRRQISAIIGRPDARPGLADYDLPTMLICGREDAITPLEFHEEMAAGITNSRLAVIEQCGHMATMEQPQAVTALLSVWLAL